MKKTLKQISVLLVFSLLLQIAFPFSGLANNNFEFKETKIQLAPSDDDLELGLKLISENQNLFFENANQGILDSYSNDDLNIALLEYYTALYSTSANEQSMPTLQKEDEIQPFIGFLIRSLIKSATNKKMGGKIADQIGKEVDSKVVPKAQDAAEQAYKRHASGSTKSKGPEQSGAPNNINQGERIIELLDNNNQPYFRLDVYKNPSGNTTNWHWHVKDDNFVDHYGNIKLYHNSLPKWGTN